MLQCQIILVACRCHRVNDGCQWFGFNTLWIELIRIPGVQEANKFWKLGRTQRASQCRKIETPRKVNSRIPAVIWFFRRNRKVHFCDVRWQSWQIQLQARLLSCVQNPQVRKKCKVLSSIITSTPRFHSSLGMQFYWSSRKNVIPWISSYLTGYILLLVMPTCLPLNSLPIPSSHRKKASLWAVHPPTLCLCWFSISLHNEYSRFNPTKQRLQKWMANWQSLTKSHWDSRGSMNPKHD